MKPILCVLLIGVSLIWTGISKADAQTARSPQNCGPKYAVLKRLAKSYGEVQQSQGLGANNAIIEVFASSTTGSWTITVTMPTGLTCLVASGQAYESLTKNDPKIGDDTYVDIGLYGRLYKPKKPIVISFIPVIDSKKTPG